jgi:alkylation response protein AidB-like acyl-CoA dehydrogenase
MNFDLTEEQLMLKDLVEKFVQNDLMPFEATVMVREASGQSIDLTEAELAPLYDQCRELGLWGLDVPEAYGRQSRYGNPHGGERRTQTYDRAVYLSARLTQFTYAHRHGK